MDIDFDSLDDFTQQYIITALWSSNDDCDNALDLNFDESDIDQESLQAMISDCATFQTKYFGLIKNDLSQAGHDFWLTRHHHGAGFWDGDWPAVTGEVLTKASQAYRETPLFVTDNQQISIF